MKKIFLGCLFFFVIFFSGYAQSSSLEGTWVLDSVSVKIINQYDSTLVNSSFIKGNIDYAVFDRIVFKDNTLQVYSNNMVEPITGVPIVNNTQLIIDFLTRIVSYKYWLSTDDRLFLEQYYSPNDNSTSYYKIVAIYKTIE